MPEPETERHLFRRLNQASQDVRREAARVQADAHAISEACSDGFHLPSFAAHAMFDLQSAMAKRSELINICQAEGLDPARIVSSSMGEMR